MVHDGPWWFLVTFVHLCLPLCLETRNVCEALRAQARGEVPQTEALVRVAGSLGRQVMHSRGFDGRTHERSHDPHDRHQFHFNFYHFHLQSILKPMGNECFFSLCLPLSIEIAEKPEDLPSDLASRPFPSSLRRPCRIRQLRKRQPLGLGALERRALECEASRESQENDGKIV